MKTFSYINQGAQRFYRQTEIYNCICRRLSYYYN